MVILVHRVSAGLSVGPSGVMMSVEAKLQVFGKRHGPGVVGQRHDRRHLREERRGEERSSGMTSFIVAFSAA